MTFGSKEECDTAARQIKFKRTGQYPALARGRAGRRKPQNRRDARLRIGRGKHSPSAEAVPNQTNPLVVDINADPETVASQHLIEKKPHIRHAILDHRLHANSRLFCSLLRPAREFRGDQFGMVECADHIAVTSDMRTEERRLSATVSAAV